MKNKMLILLTMVLPLSSCIYGNRNVSYEVNASYVDTEPSPIEKTFTDRTIEYEYVNVYRDEEDNFIFAKGGVFKSLNGIPNNMLSIHSFGFVVNGVFNTGEKVDLTPVEYLDKENNVIEYRYNISSYYNFEIINPTDGSLKLGKMVFWA